MTEKFGTLLHKARNGCAESLGQLLETARVVLLDKADDDLASELRAKEGASDLVQETFLEAQRRFASFRGHSEHEWHGWLRQTLEHNLVDAARRYQRAAKRQIGREQPLNGRDGAYDTSSPSRVAGHREEIEVLRHAVERLPEDYRDVVHYRHRDKLSHEAIGQRMGRSADAIRKLWVRALEMLADDLEIDD